MKQAISLILISGLLLGSLAAGRSFSVPSMTAAPGSEVLFPVTLDNAASCASIQIQLNHDPQILEYIGFETGTGIGSQFQPTSFAEEGVVTLIWTRATALASGNGCLGLVKFRVNAGATVGTVTPLAISNHETCDDTGVVNLALSEPVTSVSGSLMVGSSETDTDLDGMPDAWEIAHALNQLVADGAADTDRDGLSNFLEYAFGGNPQVADPGSTPLLGKTPGIAGDFMTITFDRQQSAGLIYRVWESVGLEVWNEVPISQRLVGLPQDRGDGTESITVRSSFQMNGAGSSPTGFMKVEVEKP
jgi:hypothetical protein